MTLVDLSYHFHVFFRPKDFKLFGFPFFDFERGLCGRGRDRMVVGFTTIYAISAYHH